MRLVWEDDPRLEFERGDKTYTVNEPGFAAALTIQAIQAGKDVKLPDDDSNGWRLILGPTYDELVADDVPMTFFARVALASIAFFVNDSPEVARMAFSGSLPEAPAAPEAASKATPSTPTGAARKTRRRASTSGTRTSREP